MNEMGGVRAGEYGGPATSVAYGSTSMNTNPIRAQVSGTVDRTDGTVLRWWRAGHGTPVVLVHGSFDDHQAWARVLPDLSARADVVTYDRRGHSMSSQPRGQGSIISDAEDLLALIEKVVGGPAHLVGHSYGGSIALLAATMNKELVQSVAVHEPPLYWLLDSNPFARVLAAEFSVWRDHAFGLIAAGDPAAGARVFAEKLSVGKGAWRDLLSREQRATMVANAHTWVDQQTDPSGRKVDITTLAWARFPITLFVGDQTQPLNLLLADQLAERLPFMRTVRIPGAGHAPHLTHPALFTEALFGHLRVG